MLKIIIWLTGFAFVIVRVVPLQGKLAFTACDGDLITYAVCNCSNNVTLPSSLSENLKTLTMRIFVNPVLITSLKLEQQHLKKFVNLKELVIITFGRTEIDISHDLLQPLDKLEFLNITDLEVTPPKLPVSIKNLIASSLGNNSRPDMSLLEQLEILTYRSNFDDNFPNLSPIAPLSEADLIGNPLRNMTYHDLSPFCLLKNISLRGTLIETDPVKCCGIRTWLRDVNITTDMYCGEIDSKCDETIGERDEEADQKYYECLERTGQMERATMLENVLHYIVASSLFLAVAYLVYKYYGSRAVRAHREIKRIESRQKQTSVHDDDVDEESIEEDFTPVDDCGLIVAWKYIPPAPISEEDIRIFCHSYRLPRRTFEFEYS